MAEEIIDLDSELQGIFKKEEMRAFFDFRIALGSGITARGLCKISEPKTHESGSTYFSLLFIIDVPGESTWSAVDAAMARVRWNLLGEHLAHLDNVTSVPSEMRKREVYVTETYVYVAPPTVPEDRYVASILFPAIARVTGFETGELVMWESGGGEEQKSLIDRTRGDGKTYSPSLEKLKRFLLS